MAAAIRRQILTHFLVQKKKSQALGPSKTPVKRPFHNIDKDPQDKSHLHKSP